MSAFEETEATVHQDEQQKGIQCGVHYPVPVHLQRAYRVVAALVDEADEAAPQPRRAP